MAPHPGMRFSVDPWDPSYGVSLDTADGQSQQKVDVDVERPLDGWVPLETKIFSGDPAGATRLLENAFLPKDAVPTAVNEWLVNTGDKLVLIDTGTSNVFAPTLGRMPRSLAAAGSIPPAWTW